MRKGNKHFITFVGIALALGLLSSLGLQKMLPLFLHPTVYYCQQFIHSFSTKIPTYLGMTLFTALIFFVIFIIGNVVWQAVRIRKYRKKLMLRVTSHRKLFTLLKKLHIQKETFLVKDTKPFAFCFGIRSPKIYLSTALFDLLDEHELKAVLLHESYHLQQKDTVTMLIASVSQSLFFFFPLLSDLLQNYRIEQEIKADQNAINTFSTSHILISALQKMIGMPTTPQLAIAAFADEDTLEARIHALVENDFRFKKFTLRNITISFLSLFVLSLVTLTPMKAQAIELQKGKATMVCFNGDACATWCKEHRTTIPYSPVPQNHSGM